MPRFQIGDEVRVAGLTNSQWRGMSGTIVDIVERRSGSGGGEAIQECAVTFKDQRRWFLASHLVRGVSERFVRFFRSEVLERWNTDPGEIAALSGDRDELMRFLRDRYDFSTRRAESEVEEFFSAFLGKIERATEPADEMIEPDVASNRAA
jgi:hypothetical protein